MGGFVPVISVLSSLAAPKPKAPPAPVVSAAPAPPEPEAPTVSQAKDVAKTEAPAARQTTSRRGASKRRSLISLGDDTNSIFGG